MIVFFYISWKILGNHGPPRTLGPPCWLRPCKIWRQIQQATIFYTSCVCSFPPRPLSVKVFQDTFKEVCLFVCNRSNVIQYQTWTNYGTVLHSSMSTTDNTITVSRGGRLIKGVRLNPYSGVPNS